MSESKPRLVLTLVSSVLILLPGAACKSEKSDDAPAASSGEPLASAEHKGRRELPPAALEACQGKGIGDVCSAQFGDKQIAAKCAALPDGRLACQPEHGEHERPQGS